LSLDNESIVEMINDFDRDSKALKKNIFKICWFMRGGLSFSEAMEIGAQDRDLINSIIEENINTTKETGLPFF
jgi:hypothetical protein